jgi:hypothetical protein
VVRDVQRQRLLGGTEALGQSPQKEAHMWGGGSECSLCPEHGSSIFLRNLKYLTARLHADVTQRHSIMRTCAF